jgi:hypothetical protein
MTRIYHNAARISSRSCALHKNSINLNNTITYVFRTGVYAAVSGVSDQLSLAQYALSAAGAAIGAAAIIYSTSDSLLIQVQTVHIFLHIAVYHDHRCRIVHCCLCRHKAVALYQILELKASIYVYATILVLVALQGSTKLLVMGTTAAFCSTLALHDTFQNWCVGLLQRCNGHKAKTDSAYSGVHSNEHDKV